MPGRIAIYNDDNFKKDLSKFIKNDMIKVLNPRYNTPPTMPIPALLNNGNYLYVHFGYLPSWAKDKKSMNINARNESIFEKMTFRDSFKFRRCIIPINGFFEWKKEEKQKTPFFVSSKNNDYLAIAGIWDEWFDSSLNQKIVTIALITCDANEKLGKIHHRMPIVLEKESWDIWLNSTNLQEVNSIFKIYPSDKIDIYEVTKEINKVSFDESSAIDKIKKQEIKTTLF